MQYFDNLVVFSHCTSSLILNANLAPFCSLWIKSNFTNFSKLLYYLTETGLSFSRASISTAASLRFGKGFSSIPLDLLMLGDDHLGYPLTIFHHKCFI
jgi:hypothetical protein